MHSSYWAIKRWNSICEIKEKTGRGLYRKFIFSFFFFKIKFNLDEYNRETIYKCLYTDMRSIVSSLMFSKLVFIETFSCADVGNSFPISFVSNFTAICRISLRFYFCGFSIASPYNFISFMSASFLLFPTFFSFFLSPLSARVFSLKFVQRNVLISVQFLIAVHRAASIKNSTDKRSLPILFLKFVKEKAFHLGIEKSNHLTPICLNNQTSPYPICKFFHIFRCSLLLNPTTIAYTLVCSTHVVYTYGP